MSRRLGVAGRTISGDRAIAPTDRERYALHTMAVRPWPDVSDEHRWAIELMEERFEQTTQTPDELKARAKQLRAEADRTEIPGYRDAALALADRYEVAAADRLASA